ncbi:MAG: molybdenum cofactor guanylyltransferase [Syntrophobacteraceae bacterium]
METSSVLTGAILAGGKSLRYGRNKAVEPFRGERMIDRALHSMRPHCDPMLVVANDLTPYYGVQAHLLLDLQPRQGPLGGIQTALFFSPHEWVLVRATDMPFLAPELLTALLDRREGFDVVVPLTGDRYEPLTALYHRNCLPAVGRVIESGKRQVIAFYERVKVNAVPETIWRSFDPEGLSFRNVNTQDDMREISHAFE